MDGCNTCGGLLSLGVDPFDSPLGGLIAPVVRPLLSLLHAEVADMLGERCAKTEKATSVFSKNKAQAVCQQRNLPLPGEQCHGQILRALINQDNPT